MQIIIVATIALAIFGQSLAAPSSYGGYSHSSPSYAPVGPSHSYSYPSPAPHVKCGGNLLVGCQPHVATVPCSSYHHQSYHHAAPSYHAEQSYSKYWVKHWDLIQHIRSSLHRHAHTHRTRKMKNYWKVYMFNLLFVNLKVLCK